MKLFLFIAFLSGVNITGIAQDRSVLPDMAAAENTIDAASIWRPLRALADDSMMGRRPGTPGDLLTVAYLSKAFRDAGLIAPYHNSFLQPVHLLHTSSSGSISFKATGKTFAVADSLFFIRAKKMVRLL